MIPRWAPLRFFSPGLSYGLIAAIIHARKIPSIVVTLGASFIWVGIGYSLQPTPGGSSPEWLAPLFTWQIPGVPTTIVLIALAGAAAVLIDRSPLGVVAARLRQQCRRPRARGLVRAALLP
jgi:ribose transport system ATP-binding protein